MKKTKALDKWNDEMVLKYHKQGTLFESKNPLVKNIELWRLKTIKKLANYKKDDVVLDLGCGEGFFLKMINKPKKIIGIDISRVALKKARKINQKRKKIKILWGNAANLKKIKDMSFDKITASELLEHVPSPKKVIAEMHRVLKDSGLVVISIPNEKVIQKIVKLVKFFHLTRFMKAARKQESYEWHLHQADLLWFKKQVRKYFLIDKIIKIPPILGYRLVISLKKLKKSPISNKKTD